MKKALRSFVLIPVLLVAMFVSVFFSKQVMVQAKTLDGVVDSLEIIGLKEEYFPGEVIYLKGHWQLDDDCKDRSYKGGDQFKISVPEGFTPLMSTVRLGDMGEGVWDGSAFVFTFSENIEQLVGREGGFNIGLQLDRPAEEEKLSRELVFDDGNGNTLLKEQIVINNEFSDVEEASEEVFAKGAYPGFTDNGIRWYIRVNQAVINENAISLSDEKVTIVDRVVGDQRIVPGSFDIKASSGKGVGDDDLPEKHQAKEILDDDLKGFQIELDISDGVWYNIEYETEYVGDDFDQEYLTLENEVKAFGDESGPIPLDYAAKPNIAEAEFYLGGWGKGTGTKGTAKIIKKDAENGRLLEGAEFQLTHVFDPEKTYTAISQENGEAIFEDVVDGLYYLKELKAPDNYEIGEERKLNIRFNEENDFVFEAEVTNTRERISFKGEKHWFDVEGAVIPSQEDVVLQLYVDGDLKRQMLLPKGEKEFEFKNVPSVNSKGEKIDFKIKEIANEDYAASIYFDEERALWIVENRSTVKPPVKPTEPPVEPTEPPVEPTEPPVEPTEPPVEPTEPPVKPTEPPVKPTEPPVEDPTVEATQPSVKPPKIEEAPKIEIDSSQEERFEIEVKEDEKPERDIVQSLPQTGMGISPAIPFALSITFFGLLLYLKNKE